MLDKLKTRLAFEWSVDYKPWEENLPYREYAEYGFQKGFDACLDLNLPILFAEWIADKTKHGYSKQLYEAMIVNKVKNAQELFSYFINNVYGKEI